MSDTVIIVYLFTLLILQMVSLIAFDSLVQLQRRAHFQEWERDGRPYHGLAAWKHCYYAWAFSTPPWMHKDRAAFRLLVLYRASGLLSLLGFLGGLLYRAL